MVRPMGWMGRKFFKLLMIPFMGKVTGIENIPKDKSFILVANHDSYMDHILLGVIFFNHLGRNLHFLAKKELFDTGLKRIFHEWLDAIPVDRQAGGKDALKLAIKSLKEGGLIVIHPEGTRSMDGKLQRAKTGFVRLALAAQVPVLPVGLVGTFEILPKWKKIPKFRKATINIGKLMHFDEYYGKENDPSVLRLLTTKAMKEIGKLTGEGYNFD